VMVAFAVVAVASLMLTSSQQWPAAGVGTEEPTLMLDVFSFSQDELIASAAGVETGQPRNGGGTK
ncbi:MAG TPA: hypothetical protein VE715_00835, partial [Blastocatellia bacterium]|nr:hypothetical protein [Blastocatellia bacterium]